jgi:chromosome segregation ATPase
LLPPAEDINSIKLDINECSRSVATFSNQIKSGEIMISLETRKNELEQMRISLINMTSDQESLLALKVLAIKIMHQALEDMVDSININLNKITQELFGSETIADLRLKKELKSTGTEKDMVNLRIMHKDSVYDGINSLSGGEKDRLSLAFTIALAQITNPPFLFLDECTSSLDGPLRELCTKVIRKYLKGTTVIVICHETVEGDYDSTVKIES